MNILLFIFYVLNMCFSDSPYFYDKELDEMCNKIVKGRIIEWCNPANSIAIDKKLNEKQKDPVLVIFNGERRRECYYYTKGKKIKISKEYKKIFDDDKNFTETITEIVEDLRKEYCEKKDFDIYFSVYLVYNKSNIFNIEKLNNSIDIIKKRFKDEMGDKSIIKFYPDDLRKHLYTIKSTGCIKEKTMLTLVDETITYLVFFDDFPLKNLHAQIESFVKQNENKVMDDLRDKLQLNDVKSEDIFLLSVLFKMNGNLHENIGKSQSRLLFKIWGILKNKVEFYKAFVEIFDKKVSKHKKERLDSIFSSSVQENKDLIIIEGVIDVISSKVFRSYALKYYILMNILYKNENEEELEENTRFFISVIFSTMIKNFQSLINVVLSENYNHINEVDCLRNYNSDLYNKYIEKNFFDFFKYSSAEDFLLEENEFFGDLMFKCLKNIYKNYNNEISILRRFDDEIFDEIVKKSYSKKAANN